MEFFMFQQKIDTISIYPRKVLILIKIVEDFSQKKIYLKKVNAIIISAIKFTDLFLIPCEMF